MSELQNTIIIIALIGTNIFTIWFYQTHINRLIDKMMCKSYPEYIQAKNLEQANNFPKVNTQEDPQDDQVLNELNNLIR